MHEDCENGRKEGNEYQDDDRRTEIADVVGCKIWDKQNSSIRNDNQEGGEAGGGEVKICKACNAMKGLQDFSKGRRVCKKCRSEYHVGIVRQWRKRNPERYRLLHNKAARERRKKNPELTREKERQKRSKKQAKDPEGYNAKMNRQAAAWRASNPEKARESSTRGSAAWYQRNIEEARRRKRISVKKYAQAHPEKIRERDQRRRAIQKNVAVEKFTDKEIFERDNWICGICQKKVDKKLRYPDPLSKSLDHIIPLSLGGVHARKNVCLAHFRCNSIKNNGTVPQQPWLF